MDNETRAKLFAALVRAQQAAQAVEKDSRNDFHRYAYASAEDMIAEGRRALSSAGLALFPLVQDVLHGGEASEDALTSEYLLIHESGESVSLKTITPIIPEKGRPADKAVATAKTYDLGYTLRGLLLLPRVEKGAQSDERDDTNHVPKKVSAVERRDTISQKLNTFVEFFGAPRCRQIVGSNKASKDMSIAELEAACSKLEAAHHAALQSAPDPQAALHRSKGAGGAAGDPGALPQSHESPSDSPPPTNAPPGGPPLRVVPPEAKPTNGDSRQAHPQTKAQQAPDGAATPTGGNANSQATQAGQFISPEDFWRRLQELGFGLRDARDRVRARFNLRDAGRINGPQREAFLHEVETGQVGGRP